MIIPSREFYQHFFLSVWISQIRFSLLTDAMDEIDLRKYLSKLPAHELGRIRYNPVNMLKTVLFGFMDEIIKRTGLVFENTLFEMYFPHAKKTGGLSYRMV